MNPPPETPMADKRSRAIEKGHSQAIGNFLEWMGEQGIQRMRWHEYPIDLVRYPDIDGEWRRDPRPVEQLLADYFGVDLAAVEAERRAMLDAIRAQQP